MDWIQLQPNQAQSLYGIPMDVANAMENTFYGTPIDLPHEYDVSRPLLAFLHNRESAHVVTLHIQTIEPETWEYHGMLPTPLTMEGGILSLDKIQLNGLLRILLSYREKLSPEAAVTQQMFKSIEDSRLADFRLHPEWFPRTLQRHYLQIHDPLVNGEDNSTFTILILSKSVGFSKMNLQIKQFSSIALQDLHFQPLDRGYSRVNLDRNGLDELAALLQSWQTFEL